MQKKINRREFLKKGAATAVASTTTLLANACSSDETPPTEATSPTRQTNTVTPPPAQPALDPVNINLNQQIRWRMVTTWPATLPIFMDGVRTMAEQIRTMSLGQLEIEVYGAGELVPAFSTFDAVMNGEAEMGHGASYYWADRIPAAPFFTTVPFGMNAQQMYGWFYASNGLSLWEQVYEDFNLIPIPAGNSGVQMGGWFNKEINTIEDFANLKMRIPGLGGSTLAKVGGVPELAFASDIYTRLERGFIDAAEWVGPYHDLVMGLYKVAKFYYFPGWHEPGTVLELIINRQAFASLTPELQNIIRMATMAQNVWMLSQFEGNNNSALKELIETRGVLLRQFPQDVLNLLQVAAEEVIIELAESDPLAMRVFESFRSFQESAAQFGNISERAYYNLVQRKV